MNIKIIPNPRKDWAKQLVSEVESLLVERGHKIVRKGADITICIGGDGTILYAHHKGRLEGKIIGIGSKTSYVCQLVNDSWENSLIQLIEHGVTVPIMSIEASISGKTFKSLNDFVVHTNNYRIIKLEVSMKNTNTLFSGDGVIISTSLGSPAYAYSAGGVAFQPTERKIGVVPICPYKRILSPTVLSEDDLIEIKSLGDCAFIVDGIFGCHIKKGEVIKIKKANNILFFEGVGNYKQG